MFRWTWLITMILAILWAAPVAMGDEAEESPSATPSAVDAESIAAWIRQLNADRFEERNEATRKLETAGKAACPALAEAALGENREVTLRSLEILRKYFGSGDEATKEAARQALQKVADSDHPAAARRAKEALNPPPPAPDNPAVPIFQGIPIGINQIQVQMRVAGGGMKRRIQIANGVKTIEVSEQNLEVKITEDPAGGIQMEVTEKKDGKETTKKYSAKNAEELKKKEPDAYKVYDKYAKQQMGGIQIQAVPALPR